MAATRKGTDDADLKSLQFFFAPAHRSRTDTRTAHDADGTLAQNSACKGGSALGKVRSAGKRLLRTVDIASLRGKRDYATLAILLGCGLRRAELTALRVEDIQQREELWVIADRSEEHTSE